MTSLSDKESKLQGLIKELGSVLVCFSAGVDSSYLLASAVKSLGAGSVHAVTSDSQSLPEKEKIEAATIAGMLGVSHEFIHTEEFAIESYMQNGPDRCFYCRDALFRALKPLAQARGLKTIIYGATADDTGDYRPGMKAAANHGVRAPLLEVGLGKSEIRELSKQMGLPTYDKPAMACLSSRIPYGEKISFEKLSQIERAERFLKEEYGLRDLRVRHHGSIARIEVLPGDMLLVVSKREELVRQFKSLGFSYITLDLLGFRSGSLNEVLN